MDLPPLPGELMLVLLVVALMVVWLVTGVPVLAAELSLILTLLVALVSVVGVGEACWQSGPILRTRTRARRSVCVRFRATLSQGHQAHKIVRHQFLELPGAQVCI